MIGSLRGTVVDRHGLELLVEVGGVGYRLQTTPQTVVGLGDPGDEVFLWVHHHIREDAQALYGFATRDERNVFEVLIGTHGVGPSLGLAILSTVGSHFTNDHIAKIAPTIGRGLSQLDPAVQTQVMHSMGANSPAALTQLLAYVGGFPTGATHAFLVGVFMMLAGSAIVWIFLDVKHEELATDAPEKEGVHVG